MIFFNLGFLPRILVYDFGLGFLTSVLDFGFSVDFWSGFWPSILYDWESRWPQRELKKSSNVHESHPVVGCTKDIVTNAAARRGVDEINFGGSYFCDDAYVSHNTPTGAVSFETDDIARSCVGDGYMHSCIMKEG